jgi:hypothetical protein
VSQGLNTRKIHHMTLYFNIYFFKLASLAGGVPISCAFRSSHIIVAEGVSLLGCDAVWLGVAAQGGTVWNFVCP